MGDQMNCLREMNMNMCGACEFYDEAEGTCTATKEQIAQINKEIRETIYTLNRPKCRYRDGEKCSESRSGKCKVEECKHLDDSDIDAEFEFEIETTEDAEE